MRSFIYFIVMICVLPVLAGNAYAAYDKPYIGDVIEYKALHEDTFVHLARDYNLGFTEMRAANPYVDPWLPGEGTELLLPTRHLLPDTTRSGIVINLPEMRLYAYVNGDKAPSTFPIGVGREGLNTPVGKTKVVRKKEGPTWTPTPRMRREDPELEAYYPPGPDNPLGTHALYLGWPTYAIHGTNKPFGIGRRISSGCIRMYPENITRLYEMIPVGTKVEVVNQPIKLAWIGDRLYLEAHPDLEQAIQMEEYGQVSAPKLSEADLKRIIKVAGAHEEKLRWPAIRMAIKERKGYPIEIARQSRQAGAGADALEDAPKDAPKEDVQEVAYDPEVQAIIDDLTDRDEGREEAAAEDLDEPEFEEETVVVESETPQELRSMSFNQ